jgi:phosphomannomutase
VKQSAIQRANAESTKKLGRYNILRKENMDGVKFFLDAPAPDNGAIPWVLLRASGTEPLLRVYSEAATPELVTEILKEAEVFVNASA